jgi:ATP dependent DNA ligase C terminal region
VWVRPELVAEVEFVEWTPEGHLRHARFVGRRGDGGWGSAAGMSASMDAGSICGNLRCAESSALPTSRKGEGARPTTVRA